MDALFLKLLNMSITAGWLVLAVIVLRLFLKKAPKWITCALWSFVAIRLVCPFTPQSMLSLIPSAETLPKEILISGAPQINSGLAYVNQRINPIISRSFAPNFTNSITPLQVITFIAQIIWVAGMIAMAVYALISCLRIYFKVRESVRTEDNIRLCDHIPTPFIFGLFRPKIYLPSSMDETDVKYVLLHEKAHLKRKDHVWKPLGFLLLTVYWFNPILWVAYILLCKDIELACDEKVIRETGAENKKAYSNALINCSVPRKMIAACPLAFGEVSVKVRVKSVLSYKKPALWVIIAAVAACITAAVCFLTNPAGIKITQLSNDGDYSRLFSGVAEVAVIKGENSYTVTDKEAANQIIRILQDVKIDSSPLSKNRGENRDKTNRITINNNCTLCFSGDYSELWFDNGVKPTLSYKVLNPSTVKKAFDIKVSEKATERITSNFAVVDSGSDIDGVSVSIKQAVLDTDKPYIRIELKNENDSNINFPESFDIQYYADGKRSSCATEELYFDALNNTLQADEKRIKNYPVNLFDLSKEGKYRFQIEPSPGKYLWIDFEISAESEAHIGGADSPEQVITSTLRGYAYITSADTACLSLTPEIGSCSFNLSLLSSYFPQGTYEENDEFLIMKTDDGKNKYTFKKSGDDLIFDAKSSSEMPKYKYSADAQPQTCVPDGAVFKRQNLYPDFCSMLIYDRITADIDDDGIEEICALAFDPHTGMRLGALYATENSILKYGVTFTFNNYDLAFTKNSNGKVQLKGVTQGNKPETHLFDISVKGSKIFLSENGKDIGNL